MSTLRPLPSGSQSPSTKKWLRTVLGVDHIPKSALLSQDSVPCFTEHCRKKALGNGVAYCHRHACSCLVLHERRCPAPVLKGSRFCSAHSSCAEKGCGRAREGGGDGFFVQFEYCSYHTCQTPSCPNRRLLNSPHCLTHLQTCTILPCTNPTTPSNPFCQNHSCLVPECTSRRDTDKWCQKHIPCAIPKCQKSRDPTRGDFQCCPDHLRHVCPEDSCTEKIPLAQETCERHRCRIDGCTKAILTNPAGKSTTCKAHTCIAAPCTLPIDTTHVKTAFCHRHKCLERACKNPAFFPHSVYCRPHKCGEEGCHLRRATGEVKCRGHMDIRERKPIVTSSLNVWEVERRKVTEVTRKDLPKPSRAVYGDETILPCTTYQPPKKGKSKNPEHPSITPPTSRDTSPDPKYTLPATTYTPTPPTSRKQTPELLPATTYQPPKKVTLPRIPPPFPEQDYSKHPPSTILLLPTSRYNPNRRPSSVSSPTMPEISVSPAFTPGDRPSRNSCPDSPTIPISASFQHISPSPIDTKSGQIKWIGNRPMRVVEIKGTGWNLDMDNVL